MKIRNGFVSNSSSSSFVIRGTRIKKVDLANALKIEVDKVENLYTIPGCDEDFRCQSDRDYFDGKETGDVVIGLSFSPDDGTVFELPDDKERDERIVSNLTKIGIKNYNLSTFFQYVSNDNC